MANALPQPGTIAPKFTALDDQGRKFTLASHKGSAVVLYFYPKSDTPGCTTEACEFRDATPAITKKKAIVVGVSHDPVARQARFKTKYGLPFLILADEDRSICEAYGVWQEKSMYGRKYMGVARTTFLIDEKGRIAKVFEKVKPKGHAAEVLAAIEAL
ncbi:MAG: thioredoxin-dependent thiol peroxidase [Bryobacterales bacterium]|nr:thioredoxin-dependent thiol peroxidase [Bryobacterales bacterium]